MGDNERFVLKTYGIDVVDKLLKTKSPVFVWYKPWELFKKTMDDYNVIPEDQGILLNALTMVLHYYSYDYELLDNGMLRDSVKAKHEEIARLTEIKGVTEKFAICLHRAGYTSADKIFTDSTHTNLVNSVPDFYRDILNGWTYGAEECNRIYARLIVMRGLNDPNSGIETGPPNLNFPGG